MFVPCTYRYKLNAIKFTQVVYLGPSILSSGGGVDSDIDKEIRHDMILCMSRDDMIREMRKSGATYSAIAKVFKITRQRAHQICRGVEH